jgi:Sulfotransferase domain
MQNDGHLELVVHIGSHKTGTTAIQEAALQRSADLLASGIFYPAECSYFRDAQHSRLADLMKRGRVKQVQRFLAAAAKNARSFGATTVFLSGEELWTLSPRSVARFHQLAEQLFDSIRIVCVIRKDRDRILSNFKHFLRHDRSRSLKEFLRNNKMMWPARDIWHNEFAGKLVVLNYEDLSGNLVPEFFRASLACEISLNPRSNVSFDMLSLAINHVFLKDWAGEDIEAALWDYFCEFKAFPEMPIELAAANELENFFIRNSADRQSGDYTPPAYDPIEICERMIYLFTSLRSVFQKRYGQHNPVNINTA